MMGMPRCREVSGAVASGALDEAPIRRRLAVRLHLVMCRHCRRYARQLRAIGRATRELLSSSEAEDDSVERLRRALLGRTEPRDGD